MASTLRYHGRGRGQAHYWVISEGRIIGSVLRDNQGRWHAWPPAAVSLDELSSTFRSRGRAGAALLDLKVES